VLSPWCTDCSVELWHWLYQTKRVSAQNMGAVNLPVAFPTVFCDFMGMSEKRTKWDKLLRNIFRLENQDDIQLEHTMTQRNVQQGQALATSAQSTTSTATMSTTSSKPKRRS
jgi:hypothetical protein